MEPTKDQVLTSLTSVIDPELGINVVDLGLIYEVIIESSKISIDMTLTTPGCPMAGMIAAEVEQRLRETFEGLDVEVSLVWDPPWSLDRMSETAKQQLGYAAQEAAAD
jgi:metal-sulfur cluster biosynthetic enzyme